MMYEDELLADEFNPYRRFLGLFVPYVVAECPELMPGAKLCYGRLMAYAGANGVAWPSLRTLAKSLGVSERMAQYYIKQLEDKKFIRVRRRQETHQSSVYTFLRHPVLHPNKAPQRLVEEEQTLYEPQDPAHETDDAGPAQSIAPGGADAAHCARLTQPIAPGLTQRTASRPLEIQKEEFREEIQPRRSHRRPPAMSSKRSGPPEPNWMKGMKGEEKEEDARETNSSQDDEADAVTRAQELAGEERRRKAREAEADVVRLHEQVQAGALPKRAYSAGKRQVYKPWSVMSEDERIAVILDGSPEHKAQVLVLEQLWLAEFASAFPDEPPDANLPWEAHHFRDALFLLQKHPSDEVACTLRYVIREWNSIREKVFKGDAKLPVLRMVAKLHADFVGEARAWEKWAPALKEYDDWCAQNPNSMFPPPDLQARYEAAKKALGRNVGKG